MNLKKTILAVAILFIISNVLTTGWYMAMDSANTVPFSRHEPNYIGLVLNHLVFVGCFIYLFPSFIQPKNTINQAIIFGATMAIIMFIPTGMVVRSIWQVDFDLIFMLNTCAHLVIGAILGIVLRTIYNHKHA